LYWHAAGYNETDPVYAEHFGITTIEAASAGAVPLVYAGGGQLEILHENIDGLFWKTPNELQEKTLSLISTPKKYDAVQAQAILIWKKYSEDIFLEKYDAILNSYSKNL
jgi:glycosyltransferase involved in cell wall biosynthesis